MLFTSFYFLSFFLITWLLWYFFTSARRIILFFAGIFFISSFSWVSAALCLALSAMNFTCGKVFERRPGKTLYLLAQILNIGLIPAGNYFSSHSLFFTEGNAGDLSRLLFAAGLSFYGLQHYAYLNDVKAKRIPAEQSLLLFLLSSSYFLKFLSGPITFHQQLKPGLLQQEVATVNAFPALNRVLIGYFKKMVVADALAPSVNSIFDYGDTLPGITILAGAFLFTLQLYFDFSGYCDIAIGCSLLFGISLPENFNMPLRARSMTGFWRRWHITLLDFFTRYVFYPLSFNLRKMGRNAAAIGVLTVFVLSAIWHGFGFTFLVWGFCHASFVLIEHYFIPNTPNKSGIRKMAGTISVLLLFSFSNIFFRSPGWQSCVSLIRQVFDLPHFFPGDWPVEFLAPLAVGGHQIDVFNFWTLLVIAGLFLAGEERVERFSRQEFFRPVPAFVLLLTIFVFGVFASGQRFIYMQF
jgi:alginate O-acetyltransferase complex protein AlgI